MSFVVTNPELQKQIAASAEQSVPPQPAPPSPPSQPRAGFLRTHLQHFRTSLNGDKQTSPTGSTNTNTSSSHLSHVSAHENPAADDDEDDGAASVAGLEDSLSAVLLANAQPMGRRSGSLDRHLSVQRTSLRLQQSAPSRSLLDNGSAVSGSSQGRKAPLRCTALLC